MDYAVHSGSVVAYSKQDEDDKVAMYKGSFFGEEVLLTHDADTVLRRSKTVQALTMCHLYILEAGDFREVIKVGATDALACVLASRTDSHAARIIRAFPSM